MYKICFRNFFNFLSSDSNEGNFLQNLKPELVYIYQLKSQVQDVCYGIWFQLKVIHWILHIRISPGTKFHFKQFWILKPNLFKKGDLGEKRKKWTSPLNFAYSN